MTVFSGVRISRRALLSAWGAIVMAGAACRGAVSKVAGAPQQQTVYFLDPNCASDTCHDDTDLTKHSCNVCYACINHARNKRWTTEGAITRAHPCCRCTIKEMTVPEALYKLMFGAGASAVAEYDRRWGFVK